MGWDGMEGHRSGWGGLYIKAGRYIYPSKMKIKIKMLVSDHEAVACL